MKTLFLLFLPSLLLSQNLKVNSNGRIYPENVTAIGYNAFVTQSDQISISDGIQNLAFCKSDTDTDVVTCNGIKVEGEFIYKSLYKICIENDFGKNLTGKSILSKSRKVKNKTTIGLPIEFSNFYRLVENLNWVIYTPTCELMSISFEGNSFIYFNKKFICKSSQELDNRFMFFDQ